MSENFLQVIREHLKQQWSESQEQKHRSDKQIKVWLDMRKIKGKVSPTTVSNFASIPPFSPFDLSVVLCIDHSERFETYIDAY